MTQALIPQTYREVERKLRIHGLYQLPDLTAGGPVTRVDLRPVLTLTATYYDTGDLRLAREKVTLRRREGGVDDGWHLKLPSDDGAVDARDEIRLPLHDAAGVAVTEPPEELLQLVLGLTRGRAVEAVATLRTQRTPRDLVAADGRGIAELTDDSVSVLDGLRVAGRFRELEVESRAGTEDEIDAVVAILVASGAIEGGLPSKAVRALGPAAAAPPDVARPGQVGPHDPAGAALAAHLARNTRALIDQDLRRRRNLPDAVHQLRVAARRLRSGLKVFAPLVDADWANGLRGELAWIAAELGEVRDREVLEERLLRDLSALPAVEAAGAHLNGSSAGSTSARSASSATSGTAGVDRTDTRDVAAAMSVVRHAFDDERARAQAQVDEAMSTPRFLALLDALVEAANSPRLTQAAAAPCKQALPPLVAKAWRRLAREADVLDRSGSDDSWHEVRISGKRARYAVEALVPVFGAPAREFAKSLERVTELLGEHQDAVIAADTARRLAAGRRVTGTTGFVLGLLHEAERAAVLASRNEFAKVWPDISQRHRRAWLRPEG